MIVHIKTEPRGAFEECDVRSAMTIAEIVHTYFPDLPHTILSAKVNNKYEDLNFRVFGDCNIELLDMRTQSAAYVYQDSLIHLFYAATYRVLGKVSIELGNSLNQGMYIQIKGCSPVPQETVDAIKRAMDDLIAQDLPFVKSFHTREQVISKLEKEGNVPKMVELLKERTDVEERLKMYSLDGNDFFTHELMVPSTGYIDLYELMPYERGVVLRYPNKRSVDKLPEYQEQKKMYHAFGEQKIWERLMHISYVSELNKKIGENDCRDMIQISEALHEKRIAEIADMIKADKKRLVLIAGPSSSGKTTFARRLSIQLKVNGMDSMYMSTDDYFVEREETPLDENGEPNYEGFDALDLRLFTQNMQGLLAGEEVDIPVFNFISGKKEFGKKLTKLKANQVIILEGIHALNGRLTEEIPAEDKFKIYISPLTQLNIDEHNRVSTSDTRMLRRMVRDHQFRGHDAAHTLKNWQKVRDGENVNIFPYGAEADVLFNSYHIYEIAVMKKYAEPLLKAIGPDTEEYAEACRMMSFLAYFRPIENDSVIVNNSILREFVGGSVFVD